MTALSVNRSIGFAIDLDADLMVQISGDFLQLRSGIDSGGSGKGHAYYGESQDGFFQVIVHVVDSSPLMDIFVVT
ncbi:hypothetical protein D3C76_1779880 [compost metagenome]